MQTLFLVDGSSYFYRAFFGLRGLSTSTGFPTNAIFVFANMLVRLGRQHAPDFLGVVFDAPGKTFRDDLYPKYKANRAPMPEDLSKQIPVIKKIPEMFAIKSIEAPEVEADDVIGTLARQSVAKGIDTVILTGDKDFMQLVSKNKGDAHPGILLYDDMKEQWTGIDQVVAKFGVPPERVIDVQGLMGDPTDNIPGVHGIGEKTAAKLIQAHGSIDEIYRHLDRVEGRWRALLERDRAGAELSRRLATIKTDVPLPVKVDDLKPGTPDKARLAALFRELEFTRLLQDLGEAPAPERKTISYEKYRTVFTPDELKETVAELRKARTISLDLETTSADPMRAAIVGITVCVREGESRYIPVGHTYLGAPPQRPVKEVLDALRPILEDPERRIVGQNIKYDALVLSRHGVEVASIAFDTMVASYLVNPDQGPHNLASISRNYLGHDMILYEDVVGRGAKQTTFDQVPIDQARDYSGEDADVVFRLVPMLQERLEKDGLSDLMRDVELPLIGVLLDMERTGVRIDAAVLQKLSREFSTRMRAAMDEVHRLAGETFNLDSPKQLQRILFQKLGLKPGRKTKTGLSTDVAVLEKLAADHPLPDKLLEYRQLAKLRSTYVDALPAMIHPETGRVHTSYNQAVAATGRLSSSDPNLQNIPIRSPEGRLIRTAFVPAPGALYVSADYSQIELRVMAHLSADPRMTAAFLENRDIHRATAAEIFEVDPAEVTDDQRRKAKEINFGILYGMSAGGMAQRLRIDHKTAQDFIARYFGRYARVKEFIDQSLETARKTGYVTTALGRRRYVPGLASKNAVIRNPSERIAVNAPIQGTAADIMKLAMIGVWRRLRSEKLRAKMILQVHDELVVEAPEGEAEAASALLREEMERAFPMSVPLKVSLSRGGTWAELEK
ncbi:MAG TPA: DNA polymerase I [Planctomycetota bacterium]|nr:DNA polymerase I [Planctomycetota bacterium]